MVFHQNVNNRICGKFKWIATLIITYFAVKTVFVTNCSSISPESKRSFLTLTYYNSFNPFYLLQYIYKKVNECNLHQYTLVLVLKPSHCIILCYPVLKSNSSRLNLAPSYSVSWSNQYDKEVHTKNTWELTKQ